MDINEIKIFLQENSSEKNKEGMIRFGIRAETGYGVSVNVLRRYAKKIGKDHRLSMELYKQNIHEMKLLACFIADPEKIDEKESDNIAEGFYSWDLCDQWCCNVLDKTPFAWKKAIYYTKREEEFVKRAGFVLMCCLAVHDKKRDDKDFLEFFPYILKECTDERNFVRKAVNWAIRQIGKRSVFLNKEAIRLAERIKAADTKASRWIADDALRELKRKRKKERKKEQKKS